MNVTEKLEDVERRYIEHRFKFFNGNKTKTAISLGIAIRTLDSKLEKYAKAKAASASVKADAWLPVESTAQVPKKQQVSVPERKEVQKVLSA
jgi:Bacterial regulatory protein, Fis family